MTQKPGHRPLSLPNLLIPRLNIESGSDSPSLMLRNIPFFQKYWLRSLHDLLDLQTRPFSSSESFTMKTGESERTVIELKCGLNDRPLKVESAFCRANSNLSDCHRANSLSHSLLHCFSLFLIESLQHEHRSDHKNSEKWINQWFWHA